LEENELTLPHVFEELDDEDSEGPNECGLGVNGFDLDLDLDRDEDKCVLAGVAGAVLIGEGGVEVHLVGDEGALEGEDGSGIG